MEFFLANISGLIYFLQKKKKEKLLAHIPIVLSFSFQLSKDFHLWFAQQELDQYNVALIFKIILT